MVLFSNLCRRFSTKIKTGNRSVKVLISSENDIYFNLALENALLKSYGKNMAIDNKYEVPILFLWRNSPCVIVGCNQNVWSECNLDNVRKDGVNLVRRFTGGGAVYQDLGNTCFTFISSPKDYSFERNCNLICSAVTKLIGEKCEPSGRNDLCVNGLKFSGSAFKLLPNAALHHGTLLININQGSLDKYLTPDISKLEKHNVKSVKARVTNLCQFNETVTHEMICNAIIDEVASFYKSPTTNVEYIDAKAKCCNDEAFQECYHKLKDTKWIYGEEMKRFKSLKQRFDFGSIEICFDIQDGNVVKFWVYSDSLETDFITWLQLKLNQTAINVPYEELGETLKHLEYEASNDVLVAVKKWLISSLSNEVDGTIKNNV
ncbi:lipoyltransferase and lipoate-protein ligase family protein [Babesia bovis T2Bo]|uniref:lipoate--protein ligase n=1 Tax=Babesia bovis TaxID=5865 RepID=A7AWP7_BABBO|nr:lipoyltransferase and lipoate-protein ligase family protein [Babesia bovis T2Bo]EDO05475.1 lipoyltransferase and lipoate-protein ligase family protein [Babesia bovis T2Bo]|eukprot:XP_001609043.1 lipoate-protein ligase A [Babesia bovis T2Bo]